MLLLSPAPAANAAEPWPPEPPVYVYPVRAVDPRDVVELHFAAMAHGLGSVETGTYNVNISLVTPRLKLVDDGFWADIAPRIQVGASWNTQRKTNFAYADLLWTWPLGAGFFLDTYVGAAIHDGELAATVDRVGLGCRTLFHAGAALGYRFDEHLSVAAIYEHLSNGKELFGVHCGENQLAGGNQGLNNVGIRFGYAF
jgi:hypothetical protein